MMRQRERERERGRERERERERCERAGWKGEKEGGVLQRCFRASHPREGASVPSTALDSYLLSLFTGTATI